MEQFTQFGLFIVTLIVERFENYFFCLKFGENFIGNVILNQGREL